MSETVASTETVRVALGPRSYDVVIGDGLIDAAGSRVAPLLRGRRVAIVTDETVAALHLDRLRDALGTTGARIGALALPGGEATKGWRGLERAVEWLVAEKIARDDLVVALGGGVVGDLAGFAAAILRRGVRLVQVPTTLLAQVDSSVGGKTGINSVQGKNLIGAFHQPALVLADTGALATLPERELKAGYAEVAKYGLLGDAAFFEWLERRGPALLAGDAEARRRAVARSCAMKAEIVARDETEEGERALLNLGHTFGHALEAATGYSGRLIHGEAVAIGCALAFRTAAALGLCPAAEADRVAAHFRSVGLKARLADAPGPLPDADALLGLMAQDKKVRDGRIAFVLPRRIGETFVTQDADLDVVRRVLADELEARREA
jgi:3-dehydroquinate synthase